MQNQYQKQIIKTAHLLNLVSSQKIQPLVDKYNADFSANKLHIIVFLKLFLYCWVLDKNALSLRTIAEYSQSQIFKQLAQLHCQFSVGKSSLSERLARIPWQLFQELFECLAQQTLAALPSNQQYSNAVIDQLIKQSRILDSTIITLSSKLLKAGYQINKGQLSIKASIAIHGRKIPVKALVLTEQTYSSEDKALVKLLDLSQKNTIYIFDRGIQRLQTYADIVFHGSHFVSRLKAKHYSVIQTNKLPKNRKTDTLTILRDEQVRFDQLGNKKHNQFRLITAASKKDNQELRFITSLTDISAIEITELYKYRWSIEIFFRFLKTELHLESLLSYSENGIKVHIYLTLIAFLLTWIYKEQNNIRSFKRAREKLKLLLLDTLVEQQFQKGLIVGAAIRDFIHPP